MILVSPQNEFSRPPGKEKISASFGKQILAIPWTWECFPLP
jgi:hypothetical protein